MGPSAQPELCTCSGHDSASSFRARHRFATVWIVGDSDSEVEVGKNAGCRTVSILEPDVSPGVPADFSVRSLLEAVASILRP
jgi:phosphoglycolate phosphatase-like HAD superfamily hydrolase